MHRLLRTILAPLFACSLMAAAPPEPPPASPLAPRRCPPAGPARDDRPHELSRVTVAAVGDVLPHVSVKLSADVANAKDDHGASTNHAGYDALFADVAPELSAADLAVANLETPVSPSGDGGTIEYHFNAIAPMLEGLKAAGLKLVSFANNHVFDQGRKGFAETLDQLDKAGLPFYGAGRTQALSYQGLRLTKNGVRLAFLGATQLFNGKDDNKVPPKDPQAARVDDPKAVALMLEAIKAARAESDFVIVSVHWGAEYQPKPRDSEVELAHQLFEAGADVILGTHPHVLQPLEVYQAQDGRTCLVVYSLGNFISNQSYQYVHGVSPEKVGDTRDGAILRFAVARRDWGAGGVRAELADVSFLPLWTENDRVAKGAAQVIAIRTVVVEHALKAAREALDSYVAALPAIPSREQQAEVVRLRKRAALYQRRRELIESRLGPDWAADHQL